jgi:hypothetical protein
MATEPIMLYSGAHNRVALNAAVKNRAALSFVEFSMCEQSVRNTFSYR